MGIYADYLNSLRNFEEITQERKNMLKKISSLRGNRDILVFAADLSETKVPTSIDYTDILPVQDQLSNLSGNSIDIILETPGGIGEVVEDIVKQIRSKYEHVGMIIPGWSKSAGTIFAMAGDEILMGETSGLGPIDAQISTRGKTFSADAFLEGLEKIKTIVTETGKLNAAYIPILQQISPGEIQRYENAQDFSKVLVTRWLEKYKFKYWEKHSSGELVTPEERHLRAEEIAEELCSQKRWLTHGRSISINDFERLRVKITDYSKMDDLQDAITRYHILLRMSFEKTPLYKIFETVDSQIYRFVNPTKIGSPPVLDNIEKVDLNLECPQCKNKVTLQTNLEKHSPLEENKLPYPVSSNLFKCPKCSKEIDVSQGRIQIEAQTGKRVVE